MARRAKEQISEARINAILVLFAAWMGACLISAWSWFMRTAPEPGLSNGDMAMGWLGVAGILAFAVWALGFGLPKTNGIRKTSPVPLILTLIVVILALAGVF